MTGRRVDVKEAQVRCVAFDWVGRVVGHVPAQVVAELDEVLRLHLYR